MAYVRLQYSRDSLRDYAQLLSRSEILKFVNEEDYSTLYHFVRTYDARVFSAGKTIGDYYSYIYAVLRTHYGNEYVVKNEFINYGLKQLALCSEYASIHLFSEFRIGDVIADLALFNGHSVGIEIKTELDSPSRIPRQLERYLKVFNVVYLMVPVSCISTYTPFASDYPIGLISYDLKTKSFVIEKDVSFLVRVSPQQIMEVLRTAEYKEIVHRYYGVESLQGCTDFNQFTLYGKALESIPLNELNTLFIDVLKKRGMPISFFGREHSQFNQALLSLHGDASFKEKLHSQLLHPIILK